MWGNRNKPNPRGENRPNRHDEAQHHRLRHAKILKVKLPDIEKQRKLGKQMHEDPAALKEYMKKEGILQTAPESDSERPFYTACTQGPIDPYLPPEGEGKATLTGSSVKLVSKLKYYNETLILAHELKKSNNTSLKVYTY